MVVASVGGGSAVVVVSIVGTDDFVVVPGADCNICCFYIVIRQSP